MNFLYLSAKTSYIDIPWTLAELGHAVTIFDHAEMDPTNMKEDGYEQLHDALSCGSYDFLISFLFFPRASDVCQQLSIKYISWTYDSPLMSLFDDSLANSCNYTFLFDKSECDYLKAQGFPHIYHLPMAVNTSRTGALDITADDEQMFSCDVSFVGNLYEVNQYNELIQLLPEHLVLPLKTYLMHNLCNWNSKKPWPLVCDELTTFMDAKFDLSSWNPFKMPDNLFLGILILSRKLAEMDRLTVLNTICESHQVDLYTKSKSPFLNNIVVHSGVDYATEMSKVFFLSKININIALPSIESGLPLRIFDIMGCGGFVLTNYQEEIDDLFEIGKEIEVFHDLIELKEKVDYYLTHEKERLQIAMAGYQKICSNHTYKHRINQILNTVMSTEEVPN